MRYKLIFFFISLNLFLLQAQEHPKREFRGAWIQCVNGQFQGMSTDKMKETLIYQLDVLERAGINAVMFQVRPEADALYKSPYEPWSRFLTGTQGVAPSPTWDPLEFMVEECHKRAMELHAWINPYRAKTNVRNSLASDHIYHEHPEWFYTYDNKLYFDAALPECREYICKIVADIVKRYDIDAIHMDDYFYPYPVNGVDYPDNDSYARYGERFTNKADWRRSNVNRLIRKLHKTIHSVKPWVKFGVSPFGIYQNKTDNNNGSNTNGLQNYHDLYADVLLWVEKGWVDYNIPQIYWHVGHPTADYKELITWWATNCYNRPLFIGQSVSNTIQNADPQNPSVNQLPRKIALQRTYSSVQGSCHWPASGIINNEGRYRDALITEYHKYPALVPQFDFIDNKPPKKVKKLKPVWVRDGYVLFWTPPKSKKEMDKAVQYVVYRFNKKEKINIDDATHIVAITRNNYYLLPHENGETKYQYVVTALDRLHNESKIKKKKVKL
ncbi:glycoside hydrolase family 10 protein [Bacteroides sp. 519]|uniref:glycoside hydrolase family 10 protein n=1 Tax=Bacteroides sp. 519 TaxID=2302937 RepID=UPI0013D6E432|nr:family 10 glycosylhydrolase [Bacteroides sp. 519]NDV58113.1 hypothetical protein [Bacteroides sp. 519]